MKTKLLLIALIAAFTTVAQQTTDVVTGLNFPTGLAVSGNDIYIGDILGRNVVKIDATASNPTKQTIITGLSQTRDMLISGTTMYLAGSGSDRIVKLDLSQTNPTDQTLISGLKTPNGLALKGNMLYISEVKAGQERIIKVDVSSGTPTATEVIKTTNTQITDMQIVGNFLYALQLFLSADDKIVRLDITKANPTFETVYEGVFNAQRLHIVGDLLYFSQAQDPNNSGRQIVQRIKISQANPTPQTVASNIDNPNAIVTIGDVVYISEFDKKKVVKITDSTLNTGTEEVVNVAIYPNPSRNTITISGVAVKQVKVYDLSGRHVLSSTQQQFSVQELTTGMYVVRIVDVNNNSVEKKIIIE